MKNSSYKYSCIMQPVTYFYLWLGIFISSLPYGLGVSSAARNCFDRLYLLVGGSLRQYQSMSVLMRLNITWHTHYACMHTSYSGERAIKY